MYMMRQTRSRGKRLRILQRNSGWKATRPAKALEAEREANSATGGEPLTEMEESVKAGKLLTQEGALTFQDIEGWSMYELRQKMTEYNMMEDPKGEGIKAYKLFEELLSKLVRKRAKTLSQTELSRKARPKEQRIARPWRKCWPL